MKVTLSDVAKVIETLAPLELAEPWDLPGLQVGDPGATVRTIVVALDPSPEALLQATQRGAELLVTHHPLFLKPLERLDITAAPGKLVAELLRSGLNLYVAHTNLDRAEGGVNDALANRLGLVELRPFTAGEPQVKLVVTVPGEHESRLRDAIALTGGARLGGAFACRGERVLTSLGSAEPASQDANSRGFAAETRLEVRVPKSRVKEIRAAVTDAHPHREPSVDVYSLETPSTLGSLGRLGRVPEPQALGDWARDAARRLGAGAARLVGDPESRIETVAVCGGSGASLWRAASRAGAQVLVTGDVSYHTALDARAEGVALLDLGHSPSERVATQVIHETLCGWAKRNGVTLDVETFWEREPFSALGV